MDALGLATSALYSMPYLAAAAFQGAPLWNLTPSRRWKRHWSTSICSQLSTPDRGTISLVRSSSQVRKSVTKSWHPRLWISALQPSLQAPTLAGSASVTTTAESRPATGAGGGTVGWELPWAPGPALRRDLNSNQTRSRNQRREQRPPFAGPPWRRESPGQRTGVRWGLRSVRQKCRRRLPKQLAGSPDPPADPGRFNIASG